MAFTFSQQLRQDHNGCFTAKATTDGSSAAGSLSVPFAPSVVQVRDSTNAISYHWDNQMAAASVFKQAAVTTLSYSSSNGVTVLAPSDASPSAFTVTLGTGLHSNSSTYSIVCMP